VRRARASVEVPGPVSEAEALWYDLERWPAWIDGFAAVVKREGDWPEGGGLLIWQSKPQGRGRVLERVLSYEPRTGQEAEVEDEQLNGRQRISFRPQGERVVVGLELEYDLKREGPLLALTDLLFIRRALRDSLRRTLQRYAREREGDAELALEAK
jgi:uncharacterized membrane protein